MSLSISFANLGKFIQRNNFTLILFSTFALITSIQITVFNDNHDKAESLKTQIITDRSLLFKNIRNAIAAGSDDPQSLWFERYQDDDADNLINHELSVNMLVQWFDNFWQNEKREKAAIDLQQAFFHLSNIEYTLPDIRVITGNDVDTIESALNALDSFLSKKEIKDIKLPVIGTEISVSLLTIIVPIVQSLLLFVVTAQLTLATRLMSTKENASSLISNTALYLHDYGSKSIFASIFKFSRIIPSILVLSVVYSFGVLNYQSWQTYLTLIAVIGHLVACLYLDKKIAFIVDEEDKGNPIILISKELTIKSSGRAKGARR